LNSEIIGAWYYLESVDDDDDNDDDADDDGGDNNIESNKQRMLKQVKTNTAAHTTSEMMYTMMR
jgi:hypothetical protein